MLLIPYSILAIEDDSDREFMERIYVSYQRLMYHEIYQIVGDPWLTEDILQTAIEKLIHHIDTLRSLTSSKLVNYIISTAKNTAITQKHISNRVRETPYDDWLEAPQTSSFEDNPEIFVIQNEQLDYLADIWNDLDERSKFLLNGRYILHQSYAELGKELNIKPESVRMAVTRAKRSAYNLMKKRYPDD